MLAFALALPALSKDRAVTLAGDQEVPAVEGVRSLQEFWLDALVKLKWKPGESDDEYKARVAKPYDDFRVRIDGIRKIVSIVKENTTPPQKPERDKKQRRRV